ncbi:hypothetical protein L3V82_12805 [Thiotrichales bacterium 19S3-7]|nr:hypothetical protein [Thiotrichales bacterium 19S3-7]MCF6803053.1 hypothetical protein [Thiotrichales bacterium 19S3-11]
MNFKKISRCISVCLLLGVSASFALADTSSTSMKHKQALQKVYTTQQSNVMCTSGAGNIEGCDIFSKQLGDAVTEADNAGVPRDETIKTELKAVSDGLKTTQPQRVTPGIAQ